MTEHNKPTEDSSWIRPGVLNLAWLAITLMLLWLVAVVWPYQTYAWSLLLGAGAGGSAVFLVAALARKLDQESEP